MTQKWFGIGLNPYLRYSMDLPIIIILVSPLSFLEASRVMLKFYSIFRRKFSKQPDVMPRSAASHLGLCCLPHDVPQKGRQA